MTNTTKCYSFYSYKGGSGRSTTAMNTVKHLITELQASPQRPILIVDADLESAGLTFFFGLRDRISDIEGAANTTMILSTAGEAEREAAFGEDTAITYQLSEDILCEIDRIETLAKYRCAFEGLRVTFEEKSMLLSILKKYIEYKTPGIAARRKREMAEKVILFFNPSVLATRLYNVHTNPSLNNEQKSVEKQKVLRDFLPLSTFADVSHFYNCAPNTVRFLGVCANSDETQVVSNKAKNGVESLIETCRQKNYAAVIFDCGAGTQSSAHVLHSKSDVIVYCMRPTIQFALGTESNLKKYKQELRVSMEEKKEGTDKKTVIILPTAIPKSMENNPLCGESFSALNRILDDRQLSAVIDTFFCSPTNALCEVELFKWREMILGTGLLQQTVDADLLSEQTKKELEKYIDRNHVDMPADARAAYDTYKRLAEKLVENS